MLVTGATGFIGAALCRQATMPHWDVRALLRDANKDASLPSELRSESVMGDLSDRASLVQACAGVDTILHLAGQAHVGSVGADVDSNPDLQGAENLLAAALQQGVRRIVLLSSSLAQAAETGAGDVTDYGLGKLAAERVFRAAQAKGEIEVVVLRSVNVYGVGMKGNIASMISLIHRGRLPRLPPLSNRISLLGSEDLAAALILAADSPQAVGKTYTVTDGNSYSVSDIEAAIYATLGRRMPSWHTPAVILYAASALMGLLAKLGLRDSSISSRTYRNLTMDNLFDNSAICAELGFNPNSSFYDVLPDIVAELARSKGQDA